MTGEAEITENISSESKMFLKIIDYQNNIYTSDLLYQKCKKFVIVQLCIDNIDSHIQI